jgi:hypothetical protein
MSLILLEFEVGRVKGSCDVYYEPAEYDGIYLFSPEFIEFSSVVINNRTVPFNTINTVLNNIMLEAFEEYRYDSHP